MIFCYNRGAIFAPFSIDNEVKSLYNKIVKWRSMPAGRRRFSANTYREEGVAARSARNSDFGSFMGIFIKKSEDCLEERIL